MMKRVKLANPSGAVLLGRWSLSDILRSNRHNWNRNPVLTSDPIPKFLPYDGNSLPVDGLCLNVPTPFVPFHELES